MAKKKLEQVKSLSPKEMQLKVSEAQKALFENRIKLSTGQLENTSLIWKSRKEIARLKTFLTQKAAK
jgi:large subunit ribosomal protein L29